MKHLQYRQIAGTFRAAPHVLCWIVLLFALTVLPIHADSKLLVSATPEGPEGPLWELTNADSGFKVSLASDHSTYQLDDDIILRASAMRDAYLIILNWGNTGRLTLLIPNGYQQDNFVEVDTRVRFPDVGSDFDFNVKGPLGVEYFKLIALRRTSDNNAIVALFSESDKNFESLTEPQRLKVEEKILTHLRRIKSTDWATTRHTVKVQASNTPEPRIDYDKGDIVYLEDEGYKYFAKVTKTVDKNAETVRVRIFNKKLRKKLGKTVSTASVASKRPAPEKGWGKKKMLLSFYRNGEWIITKDVMAFEDHFILPEEIGKEPIRGSRKVKLGKVRIPIFDSMSKEQ